MSADGLKTSCKRLKDRSKKILSDRRSANRNNKGFAGITKIIGDRENLLDERIEL